MSKKLYFGELALLRQTRVTGDTTLTGRAEQLLTRVLHDDPGSYDANRRLGSLYLSQHRFQEAMQVGERNRAARPYDPVNYGVIGDDPRARRCDTRRGCRSRRAPYACVVGGAPLRASSSSACARVSTSSRVV